MFNVNDLIEFSTDDCPGGAYGFITDILEVKSSSKSLRKGKIIYKVRTINCVNKPRLEIYEKNIIKAYSKYYDACNQE